VFNDKHRQFEDVVSRAFQIISDSETELLSMHRLKKRLEAVGVDITAINDFFKRYDSQPEKEFNKEEILEL